MACIVTECCNEFIDLDWNVDDVITIGIDYWHYQCALDAGKVTEEQIDSGQTEF